MSHAHSAAYDPFKNTCTDASVEDESRVDRSKRWRTLMGPPPTKSFVA